MDRDRLKTILDVVGVHLDAYSLGNAGSNGQYTIKQEFDDVWIVYRDEEGSLASLRTFSDERPACCHFLERLLNGSTERRHRVADLAELEATLELIKADPHLCSLAGGSNGEQYLIRKEPDGTWAVFYYERGHRFQLRRFENENDACQYYLEWVIKVGAFV